MKTKLIGVVLGLIGVVVSVRGELNGDKGRGVLTANHAKYANGEREGRTMPDNPMAVDGDQSFVRVDGRRSPDQLEPGVAAGAVNVAFDNGKPRPRLGMGHQQWGRLGEIDMSSLVFGFVPNSFYRAPVPGFVVGRRYAYVGGESSVLSTEVGPIINGTQAPGGTQILPGTTFTATQTSYYLWISRTVYTSGTTARIHELQRPCGYQSYTSPDGSSNAVLITDAWRDGAGEDGGIGRAWRICPGNEPQEIPMNGHDVWESVRLIPCLQGLVLLRPGVERHYFVAADVDDTLDQIQLHCAPAWATGELVRYKQATDGSAIYGTAPPNDDTLYYVKNISGDKVELYTDSGLSTQLDFDADAVGKFYLERRAVSPGIYGNGAPPLLLQGTDAATPFEVGFKAAPVSVAITSTTGTPAYTVTAPYHRLIPGDAVLLTGINDGSAVAITATVYARPSSDNTLALYDTQVHALAGGATGLQTLTAGQTGTLQRQAASALPMPSGREGVYFLQRLFIVNGNSNILISDPLDPLHFTPMTSTVNANLGENQAVTAIYPLGDDTLLIYLPNSVLALKHLSASSSNWTLTEITRDYGALAALTPSHVGADVWGLSRRGVMGINQTAFGAVQGDAVPVSLDLQNRMDAVDWIYAGQACSETWNNRFFLAVPFKGQSDTIENNGVLVYNFLNKGWEDLWQGDLLTPVAFARLQINGEERLTFVNVDGLVCWFTDDFTDMGAAIETELTSRGYFGGELVMALVAEVNWDSFDPSVTVTARASGYNEEQALATAQTYDRTTYLVDGSSGNDFSQANRADYSMVPDSGLYTEGVPFDVHQNITEKFRFRMRDRAVQIVISNTQGSLRVNSVKVKGTAMAVTASRQT